MMTMYEIWSSEVLEEDVRAFRVASFSELSSAMNELDDLRLSEPENDFWMELRDTEDSLPKL